MSVIYDALKKLRRQQDGSSQAPTQNDGQPKKRPGVLERNRVQFSLTGIAMVGGVLAAAGYLGYEWWRMERAREMAIARAREMAAIEAAKPVVATPTPKNDTFTPPDKGMGTVAPAIPPPVAATQDQAPPQQVEQGGTPLLMSSPQPPQTPVGQGQVLRMATPGEIPASQESASPAPATLPQPTTSEPAPPVFQPVQGEAPPKAATVQQKQPPRSQSETPALATGMTAPNTPGQPASATPPMGATAEPKQKAVGAGEASKTPAAPKAQEPTTEEPSSRLQVDRVRTVNRLNQAMMRGDRSEIERELSNMEKLLGAEDLFILKSRAYHHLNLKEYLQADHLLQKVLARTPNDVEAAINLAVAEQGQGYDNKASARLSDLLVRFPNHPALQPYRR